MFVSWLAAPLACDTDSKSEDAGSTSSSPMLAADGGKARYDACTGDGDDPFRDGRSLFVDDDHGDCGGQTPCFADLTQAMSAAHDGDTIQLLPGVYRGISVATGAVVRITGTARPEDVVISASGFVIEDDPSRPGPGSIKLDHLTFRETFWGVFITTSYFADVRIEDSVFLHNNQQGAIAIDTSYVRKRIHARIARNRIQNNLGASHALHVELPADHLGDYCVRAENNLITGNTRGIGVHYPTLKHGSGRFEFVNNTVADNELAVETKVPTGRCVFANNIFAYNQQTFRDKAETSQFDVQHNLIDSGEFVGAHGNFSEDPAFVDRAIGDYQLRPGSPAADRGDAARAPKVDLAGVERTDSPELGAYELDENSIVAETAHECGDSKVQDEHEACDDGNREAGDRCSPSCQWEPFAASGRISLSVTDLCVIRADETLACWNKFAKGAPPGKFRQVALSYNTACALDADGVVTCWNESGSRPFKWPGTFQQITADEHQVCALSSEGVVCDDGNHRLDTPSYPGNFVRVDANARVCALSAEGEPTCWPELPGLPEGPFIQMFPSDTGGCGLRPSGELACVEPSRTTLLTSPPAVASFANVFFGFDNAVGVRPDGKVVSWGDVYVAPPKDRKFREAVSGRYCGCGCALDRDDHVYCWGDDDKVLPRE